MRDLEIRGAGNLLGPKQSGHITAVGFDLYCQLLKQSVARLRGETVKQRVEVTVRLDFLLHDPAQSEGGAAGGTTTRAKSKADSKAKRDSAGGTRGAGKSSRARIDIRVPRDTATWVESDLPSARRTVEPGSESPTEVVPEPACIPLRYIEDMRQRIILYRRIAEIADESDLARLRGELRDRFGPLPAPMERLLQVSELKLIARARSVTAVETRGDKLMLTRNGDYITVGGRFPRLSKPKADARLKEVRRLIQSV